METDFSLANYGTIDQSNISTSEDVNKSGVGSHYILDLYGCSSDALDNLPLLQQALLDAVVKAGATVITNVFHKFSPQGVTGVVVIAESHASVHTWPESGFAAFDIFTCGVNMNADIAVQHLVKALNPEKHLLRQIPRGVDLSPPRELNF